MLAAFWLPLAVTGLDQYLSFPVQSDYSGHVLGMSAFALVRIGASLAIGLIIWKSGGNLVRFGFKWFQGLDILSSFLILVLLFAASYAGAYIFAWTSHWRGAHLPFTLTHGMSFLSVVPVIAAGVFFEEVLFRSYLCTRLADLAWQDLGIGLVSITLFTLPHVYQGWGALPVVFMLGSVLTYSFMKTKSIWPVFLGHLVYDLILIYLASKR